MDKDEALKLALEALELHGKQYPHMVKGYCLDAITAIKQALAAPVQKPTTVEDNSQDWAGMDGATAWHLIDRHADGWADVAKMMGEWLAANTPPAAPVQEPEQWEHLKAYGYAPGNYMMTCRGCNTTVTDVDKRASRCKPCAIKAAAQPAPVQQSRSDVEPVAWVDWLPEGTTHIAKCKATTNSGGSLSLQTYVFKYDGDVLKVCTTDNDNEYPGWRVAKDVFYHLNFPIIPLYSTPPNVATPLAAQRQWVGLTEDEIDAIKPFADGYEHREFAKAIEAKLKEKNT